MRARFRFGRHAPFIFFLAAAVLLYVELVDQGRLPASSAQASVPSPWAGEISCKNPNITDGDTFRCAGARIRLAGIDTPEMPGHCRKGRDCTPGDPMAAKDALTEMTRGAVLCTPIEKDHYGRIIARCTAKGRDLSCAMLQSGHAVKRYSPLSCS